jgi:DNA-binding SARP family transcriptional activator
MIHLLGAVRCGGPDHGRTGVVHGVQPRLALARLAGPRDCPVSADELADVVWPDGVGYSAGALRGVVSKVRAALARGLGDHAGIANLGGCYLLERDESITVDVELAEQEVRLAEHLLEHGSVPDAAEHARSAVILLRPSFLPGLEGPWIDRRRTELARLHRRALCLGSKVDVAAGAYDEAIQMASDALELDPYDETINRALIAAHLAGGDRGGALAAYERCRRLLTEDLGLEPSPATEDLHHQLVGH